MKNKIDVAILAGISLLLTSCATWPKFVRPETVSESQFRRDNYECMRDAEMAPVKSYWIIGDNQVNIYRLCMESKGYTRIDE